MIWVAMSILHQNYNMANRKLFVTGPNQTPSGVQAPAMDSMKGLSRRTIPISQTAGTKNFLTTVGPKNAGIIAAAHQVLTSANPNYIPDSIEYLRNAGMGAVNNLRQSNNNNNKQLNQNKSSEQIFSGASDGANYALSKLPKPKNVRLNSGIHPNCYVNDYNAAEQGLCSPLHLTESVLKIPDTTTSLGQYFVNTICFDIQTRAQANVNFEIDITNILSPANMLKAFNDAIAALNVYYFYASVLAYESNPYNQNEGMIALRADITPAIMSDLVQLGKRLENTPLPPALVRWVKYMNGNYFSGDNQGSTLIKTVFDCNVVSKLNAVATTYPGAALTALNSTTNPLVFTLMRRSIPQWRVGVLTDVPVIPVYDPNFLTIFTNAQNNFWTTSAQGPSVASNSEAIAYNNFNNKLDGVAYAMRSMTLTGVSLPGLMTCNTASATRPDSRYSYYRNAPLGWYGASQNNFLTASRNESYIWNTALTLSKPHLPGATRLQGVSINSLTQTAQNVLNFLFMIGSIPRNGKVSSFDKKARRN